MERRSLPERGCATCSAKTMLKHDELHRSSIGDLFALYDGVLEELQRRKIIRSKNNPCADYAELLVVRALSLEVARKSTKGYDAKDAHGKRYEIKSRRITPANESRQLSFIRDLNKESQPFDYLVGVLFNPDFGVFRACLIPVETVLELATYREREKVWRLLLIDEIWERAEVRDLTQLIRATGSEMSDART
jgi:hypothetical protein